MFSSKIIFVLIIMLFSIFLLNPYNSSYGTFSKNQNLSSSNNLFSESLSKVPPSALYESDTSVTDSNETNVEAQTLQQDVPFIENTIKTEIKDKTSSSLPMNMSFQNSDNNSTTQNLTSFQSLREYYLSHWDKLSFQSSFNTFVEPNSTLGYGIFKKHSNEFVAGDPIYLYIEPLGFKHKAIKDEFGNNMYLTNITTTITLSDEKGNEIPSIEDVHSAIVKSYNKITELYLPISIELFSPLSPGNYYLEYDVVDNVSKEYFIIQKDLKIINNS